MAVSVGTREESSVRALLLAKQEEAQARLRRRESLNRRKAEDGFRSTVLRLEAEVSCCHSAGRSFVAQRLEGDRFES